MDMMSSIASMATSMQAANFANSYSLAVTKKVMDSQEMAAQEILEMLPDVAAMAKGQYIDTYA
ncbi:MAG: putative motility protein [Oscillospiraceae bacterium]|nr:putative motility protein [Oscillospiraceae bacterium]